MVGGGRREEGEGRVNSYDARRTATIKRGEEEKKKRDNITQYTHTHTHAQRVCPLSQKVRNNTP